MAATKRKLSSIDASKTTTNGVAPPLKRRASSRHASSAVTNPDKSNDVLDAPGATRASPDNVPNDNIVPGTLPGIETAGAESPLSDAPAIVEPPKAKRKGAKGKKEDVHAAESVVAAVVDAAESKTLVKKGRGKKKDVKIEEDGDGASVASATPAKKPAKKAAAKEEDRGDPEADGGEEDADPEEVKAALARPPPVNSDYLPLPWKGRLGYACLNTYLRASNPPVFSSRTCRIQSILEHRHPLQHPDQPEHATKNRPDRSKPADEALGKKYVEEICLANVKDIEKMLRWNEKYHIRFLRLSSEMFPFASHSEYGYTLAPFASEALASAGKVAAELGHRVTTHPGQFTQLGSPRPSVIENAFRDLTYHDEMLSLLKLPEQLNKDAVMILHMGGVFEGKPETIERFRENYAKLSDSVKARLVLENDDVCYTVHDLLPICEELNIPFVLDWHHHNILFDKDQIREGSKDILELMPRILATWTRKGITPKMHYSEQTPGAITGKQRRKHNPRVWSLPPCPDNMDLMIEAKDKEQAVFELMRTFKLPGFDLFADVLPYERSDDNKFADSAAGQRKIAKGEHVDLIPDEEIGMGGPDGRVYWPLGMEEWLRPKKREVKKKDDDVDAAVKAEKERLKKEKRKEEAARAYAERQAIVNGSKDTAESVKEEDVDSDMDATPATKKAKAAMKKRAEAQADKAAKKAADVAAKAAVKAETGATLAKKRAPATEKKVEAVQPTPSPSPSDEESEAADFEAEDSEDEVLSPAKKAAIQRPAPVGRRKSGRAGRAAVSYAEADGDGDLEMA